MAWILAALAVLLTGALVSLLSGRSAKYSCILGPAFTCAGCALALVQAVGVLLGHPAEAVRWSWNVPLGSLQMAIDPLSALFAAIIALVCALGAIYGGAYLRPYSGRKHLGAAWFSYQLLAASMLLVVVARNGVFFLLAWEIMSLSSYFLVMFEAEKPETRRAGWTYLVATHLGTAFLMAMFVLLGRSADSLDFESLHAAPEVAGLVFLLALIGFGTKAGLMPLHVWLPEAHPAAPSHVSAVMSGVMIKTGLYGLLRVVMILGDPPAWWGWTLLAVGIVSGILGVLFALAQHDLKRLLAYHSVENIGIISLGLGVGMLGVSYDIPAMMVLGFLGGLLHICNHAIFKSLLFLGAGAIQQSTGLRDIDRLGGLLKPMPITGAAFLVGACAISGLPPLNGFVSELLIYLGALAGIAEGSRLSGGAGALLGVLVIGGLAMIGGLAAACFTKAFGCVFLGEPRSAQASASREAGAAMRGPMLLLAGACIAIGLTAPLWPLVMNGAVLQLIPASARNSAAGALGQAIRPLATLCGASWGLLGIAGVVALIRRTLLRRRQVQREPTWGCGYAAPTVRMQYTASSFAWPILNLFRFFTRSREEICQPQGLFPERSSLVTETPDVFAEKLYRPLFAGITWVALKLRWLQQGRIQLYVLYVALTLLALLVWKLR
jgi:formate hydrogenlyase subunit 3/multisubunit Na+/H+ antiporter MnhD subunit